MCNGCNSAFKGKSQSCKLINPTYKRKLAEEVTCTRTLPESFIARLKLLFDIPEVKAIDSYK